MPAKFKASARKYMRGVPANKLPMEHFYMHTMRKKNYLSTSTQKEQT